jgi:hypothetical protein
MRRKEQHGKQEENERQRWGKERWRKRISEVDAARRTGKTMSTYTNTAQRER